jgi:branched-chain amino acid transport system permease protein
MWAFIYTSAVTSAVEAGAFEIDRSFRILFMIIIGGLGRILGSFLGAGFIVLLRSFSTARHALLDFKFWSIW